MFNRAIGCSSCFKPINQANGCYSDPAGLNLCWSCLYATDMAFINPAYVYPPLEMSIATNISIKMEGEMASEELFNKIMNIRTDDVGERPLLSPKEVYNYLNKYVIGQDEVKKTLSVLVSNHQSICAYNDQSPEFSLRKSNALIIGPTGTGKTLIVQTLANLLGVPFLSTSATEYSETGYVGKDTTDILANLIKVAEGNIQEAERGIIFIDEVDKIRSSKGPNGKDVSGSGVQQALLRMIEGGVINVMGPQGHGRGDDIDTSSILFIFGGAFTDLRETKAKVKNPTGFNSYEGVPSSIINTEDLIKAGLIREFAGRLQHITSTEPLTEADLLKILTEPVDSLVLRHERLMKFKGINNVDLRKKKFLKEIVKEAQEMNTGARALQVILERKLRDVYFEGEK